MNILLGNLSSESDDEQKDYEKKDQNTINEKSLEIVGSKKTLHKCVSTFVDKI